MKHVYSKTIEKSCGFVFALWSAGAKAYEYMLPTDQRLIEDPLAGYYAGAAGMKMVDMLQGINPALRKAIVIRARYMDDYARRSIEDGFTQVVLMGAGYDSRYWRIEGFRKASIFELDLESTQIVKKSLTRRKLGYLPGNVKYISIDFSKQSITQKLNLAGFKCHEKTLFIWEGVSLFLNLDIVLEILGRLNEIGDGNRVVFDFVPPELIDDETNYIGNRKLIQLCASIKEPLTFGCDPGKMRKFLKSLGYSNIKIISMREAYQHYLGCNQIEDCYYFVTAETGNILSLDKTLIKSENNSHAARHKERCNHVKICA